MNSLDALLRDVIEEDVAANSDKPLSSASAAHLPRLQPGRHPLNPRWIGLARILTAAGIAGLLWTGSMVRKPHPLDRAVEQAMPSGEELRMIMEKGADFVQIALVGKNTHRD